MNQVTTKSGEFHRYPAPSEDQRAPTVGVDIQDRLGHDGSYRRRRQLLPVHDDPANRQTMNLPFVPLDQKMVSPLASVLN
jgi:hypothetical protein